MALYPCNLTSTADNELYQECKNKVLSNDYSQMGWAASGRLTILDGGYYLDTSTHFAYYYIKISEIQDLYTYDDYVAHWSILYKQNGASSLYIYSSQLPCSFGAKGLPSNVMPFPATDGNHLWIDVCIASIPNQTTVDGRAYYITDGMEYEVYGKIPLKNS